MSWNHSTLSLSTAKSPERIDEHRFDRVHVIVIPNESPWKLYVHTSSTRSPLPEVRTSWQVKDVSNEESHPESLRKPLWHGGRLHWLETGCTSNFCNEIPQTPPTAIQNGSEGRGWREEVGRDGSREFSERLYRERSVPKSVSHDRIVSFGILLEK